MAITKFNHALHRLRNPLPARCHPPAAILATYARLHARPAPAASAAPKKPATAPKKPSTAPKRK